MSELKEFVVKKAGSYLNDFKEKGETIFAKPEAMKYECAPYSDNLIMKGAKITKKTPPKNDPKKTQASEKTDEV